ncbi:MAG: TonB-dependent receptor [Blastocatellia bacterium]
MQVKKYISIFLTCLFISGSLSATVSAQTTGSLRGTITLESSNKPLHDVTVTIIQLKRAVQTDDNGVYEFQNIPAGTYDVVAHLDRVPDVVQSVQVAAGSPTTVDIQMRLRVVGEQITVTASGDGETSFNSIQSVTSLTAVELAEKNTQSLGEALDHELGIAKRSFGPGTSRPVIRGFDGDRVLILQNGERIGGLGFQSGDHAEPVDVLTLEKLEVVKGPATLLYGSNAIGGVVNAINEHETSHKGVRGYFTGVASTNSYEAGGSAGIEYGTEHWLFWGNGGGQRSGDYDTPAGRITNSYTLGGNGSAGFGYYPDKGFLSLDYSLDRRRYGIPFDQAEEDPEVVKLNPRRQSIHFNSGIRDLNSFINGGQFSLQYNNYKHDEINSFTDEINTRFENNTLNYRATFDQRKSGNWSGSFGFWGLHRDYKSLGEEAIAPPTKQNAFALFGLQKIDFERLSLQFGARLEHNGYNPDQVFDRPTPDRSFNGFSGAMGIRIPTWKGGAFVANYSHSYRAPALEELYNNGPHPGNAAFEIGDPELKRERGDGLDLSLRQSSNRVRAEANFFYYRFRDFIFLAPTGDLEEGLIVARYSQDNARYTGAEAKFDVAVHPNLWLTSGVDYVNARLIDPNTPLPRIPPLRGRLGLEATYKSFRFAPEVIMSKDQDKLFPTETRTAGYAIFNATASYTIAQQHTAQVISLNAFNLGDRLYLNHLSFIKNFAPEIGRGVRLTYTLRFY